MTAPLLQAGKKGMLASAPLALSCPYLWQVAVAISTAIEDLHLSHHQILAKANTSCELSNLVVHSWYTAKERHQALAVDTAIRLAFKESRYLEEEAMVHIEFDHYEGRVEAFHWAVVPSIRDWTSRWQETLRLQTSSGWSSKGVDGRGEKESPLSAFTMISIVESDRSE